MAIDFSIVYQNPTVDRDGIYFTQISNIQFERIDGYSRPRILVQVKILSIPNHATDVFSAVIDETPYSDDLYHRFLQSFHLTDTKLPHAVNAQGFAFFEQMERDGKAYSQLDFGLRKHLEKAQATAFEIRYLRGFIEANLPKG
jgi:hypothetical protein